MSDRSFRGIARLVRWRDFEEDRASIEVGRARVALDEAGARAGRAMAVVAKVRAGLDSIVQAPVLDLGRLQVANQIAYAAWQDANSSEALRADAQAQLDAASRVRLQARASTRVAQARKNRVAVLCRDREEKTAFDEMADLYRPGSRRAT